MNLTTNISPFSAINKLDENILVIKRSILFHEKEWYGILTHNAQNYLSLIDQNKEFLPRSCMEQDESYKQIIPYVIFTYNNRYFLMQRSEEASETRLQNKFSLGIGGHIRREDIHNSTMTEWVNREFEEEISYNAPYTTQFLGLLNDDTNSVGKVHLGLIYIMQGTSDLISVKSELKSGNLSTLYECREQYDNLETWSRITLDYLMKDIA